MIRYLTLLLVFTFGLTYAQAGQLSRLPAASFYQNFVGTHFVNQDGQAFKPGSYLDKVVLFHFIYTKCANTCPVEVKQLVDINQHFSTADQSNIQFVFVSLDSQFDKPDVLKAYAKRMGAVANNMQFLSGHYQDIKTLQDKLHLFGNPNNPSHPKFEIQQLKTTDKENVLKKHMTNLWVVDKQGNLIQRYAASPMNVSRVERELKQIADL